MIKKLIKNLFLLFFVSLLIGCITVKGKVAVYGNAPNTFLGIITEDKTLYKIVGKYEKIISEKYQQKVIKVKGRIIKEGNGTFIPAELEVLEILEVK